MLNRKHILGRDLLGFRDNINKLAEILFKKEKKGIAKRFAIKKKQSFNYNL